MTFYDLSTEVLSPHSGMICWSESSQARRDSREEDVGLPTSLPYGEWQVDIAERLGWEKFSQPPWENPIS